MQPARKVGWGGMDGTVFNMKLNKSVRGREPLMAGWPWLGNIAIHKLLDLLYDREEKMQSAKPSSPKRRQALICIEMNCSRFVWGMFGMRVSDCVCLK